jgi:hypothetical protein
MRMEDIVGIFIKLRHYSDYVIKPTFVGHFLQTGYKLSSYSVCKISIFGTSSAKSMWSELMNEKLLARWSFSAKIRKYLTQMGFHTNPKESRGNVNTDLIYHDGTIQPKNRTADYSSDCRRHNNEWPEY